MSACNGYQELQKSWENYEPLPFIKIIPNPVWPGRFQTPVDKDFCQRVQKLDEMKRKWEDSLKVPVKEKKVLPARSCRFEHLLPAGRSFLLKKCCSRVSPWKTRDSRPFGEIRSESGRSRLCEPPLDLQPCLNLDEILRQSPHLPKD